MKNIAIVGAGDVFGRSSLVREKLEQFRVENGISIVEFENIEAALEKLCGKQEIVLNEWDQLSITTKEILNKNRIFKEPKRKFVNKFNKNKHR